MMLFSREIPRNNSYVMYMNVFISYLSYGYLVYCSYELSPACWSDSELPIYPLLIFFLTQSPVLPFFNVSKVLSLILNTEWCFSPGSFKNESLYFPLVSTRLTFDFFSPFTPTLSSPPYEITRVNILPLKPMRHFSWHLFIPFVLVSSVCPPMTSVRYRNLSVSWVDH